MFNREKLLILLLAVFISGSTCKKEEKNMVDMETINTDGSHNERYIFRKEIEKEEKRDAKKREPEF